MDEIIKRFRDYQIEWLTAHNDIEFCEEEEKLIIGFLKDTAESFVRENQSTQQWIPPRRCIDCENFNKTQLLVPQSEQKRWIPCSEEEPSFGIEVLITRKGTVRLAERSIFDKEYPWYIHGHHPYSVKTVDAWMPLPEPYKEEK